MKMHILYACMGMTLLMVYTNGASTGPRSPANEDQMLQEDDGTLGPALNELARIKREMAVKNSKPYSSYGPSNHRYRYPLYKKRSATYSRGPYDYGTTQDFGRSFNDFKIPLYMDEPQVDLAKMGEELLAQKYGLLPSMSDELTEGAYFDLPDTAYRMENRDRMYDQSRNDRPVFPMRRPLPRKIPYLMDSMPNNVSPLDELARNGLAKFSDPWDPNVRNAVLNNPIRKKRAALYPKKSNDTQPKSAPPIVETQAVSQQNVMIPHHQPHPSVDRPKRGYNPYVPYVEDPYYDESDLLAREYFKSLARATGNKKKRMAFASFQPDKRSTGIEAMLENPSLLQYAQEKLKEAEEKVVDEAEGDLRADSDEDHIEAYLEKTISRLDALEKIKDSLHQLELLQEEDVMRKRSVDLGQRLAEQGTQKRAGEMGKRRKTVAEVLESEEQKWKRKSDITDTLFQGNRREECPILERIVLNCVAVSRLVGDGSKVFVEPCLFHEICYMCGAERDVTKHECDAVLSSGLESGCSRGEVEAQIAEETSECHKAAGETYNILTEPNRYDDKGTCTHDPCIRQLLESR